MRVGINCGHTVSGTTGCGVVGFLDESVETREVGYALEKIFRENGHIVVDCTDDYSDSVSENLRKICVKANAQTLDLFISIHFNSGGGTGVEVWTYKGEVFDAAEDTAQAITDLGYKNRGIKDGSHLYVVHRSNAKAMLVECCFADSQDDVEKYRNLGAETFARAIYKGVVGEHPANTNKESEEDMAKIAELEKQVATLTGKVESLEKQVEWLMNQNFVYNYVDGNMPDWAKPSVQKLMDKGVISGEGEGLGLTNDLLKTICYLDRLGLIK